MAVFPPARVPFMDRILEFSANHTLLVFALVTSFLLAVFTELRRKAAGVSSVEAGEAVRLINNDAAVIDLRSAEAFGRGHIVNARNVPSDELSARLDKLGALKSKPVVIVCEAGITSSKALATLKQAGFETVYSLKGGMTGWSQAGMPLVTAKKTKKEHHKKRK